MADETPCQVLKEEGRYPTQKSYMWAYRTGEDGKTPIILFEYQSGCGGKYPKAFLEGFTWYLQTDGYAGYNCLPDVTRVTCWAHMRRKWNDAIPSVKGKTGITHAEIGLR